MSDIDIDERRAAALDEILIRLRGEGIRYKLLDPEPSIVARVVAPVPPCHARRAGGLCPHGRSAP